MQHYVGLDVSLKQTAVCVVDQAGKIIREGMVASEPKAIADFIAANAPQVVRIGFESGATSTWLWTELKKFGLPVICIDARQPKAALKMHAGPRGGTVEVPQIPDGDAASPSTRTRRLFKAQSASKIFL
jgi:transposase